MFLKDLGQLSKEDIEQLVTDGVPENRTLEYKETFPDLSNKKKKEKFLALISSFANSVGGYIIYGIREQQKGGVNTGKPGEAVGVALTTTSDQELLRMKHIINTGIEPRIVPNIETRVIDGFKKGPVVVFKIHKSFTSPHMVWLDKKSNFYIRGTNGTDPMDVGQVRTAFTLSANLAEEIKNFRAERLANIISRKTPVDIVSGAKLVLHITPVEAFDISLRRDYIPADSSVHNQYAPECTHGCGSHFNFDGFVAYSYQTGADSYKGYCQFFRTGILEMVLCIARPQRSGPPFLFAAFEDTIISETRKYLERLDGLNIPLPIFLLLSLLNVRGYGMYHRDLWGQDYVKIDRDHLILPEVIVTSYEDAPAVFLRSTFDAVWQACGYAQSPYYNEDGSRKVE